MKPRLVSLALGLAIAAAPAAGAQTFCDAVSPNNAPTCSRDHQVLATVAHILRLDLSTLATTMLAPDLPQFDSTRAATSADQLPLTSGPTITVRANRPWALKVMAAAPHFSFDPDPLYQIARSSGKPATDLTWSINADRGFVPMSPTTPTDVASSPATGSYGQFVVYFRTRWDYSLDVPGLYGLYVTFTLTGL